MKPFVRLVLTVSALAALAAGEARAQATVAAPARRQETLAAVSAMLAQKDVPLVAKLADPFFSEAFAEASGQSAAAASSAAVAPAAGGTAEPARPAGPRSDRDVLAGIAAALKPSGFFVLGGQPTLVFGQKRVKAGGLLTITFEGTEYTVEITALNRTTFTLRLNREEFTRPIK